MTRTRKENIQIGILTRILSGFFFIEKFFVKIKNVNYPKQQVLFSIWHGEQCVVYGNENKEKFYVLVSASNDGEIISKAVETLGIKSIRGSSKRRAVAGSLELLDVLKDGNSAAIMVDGPRGPKGKVKDGIINLAKLSGVPIVPVSWQSKERTFLKFNSWDNFRIPVGPCKTIALYGEPIYIPSELTREEQKEWCEKLEEEMAKVQNDLSQNFDEYLKK